MKVSRNVISFLALLLFTGPVFAQEYHPATVVKKLPNGLTIVVSEEHSAPTLST